MIELVLGGARSGKSRYAEQQAIESGKQVVYIATAQAGDAEMQLRIEHHREQRPHAWQTIEEPVKLAKVIQEFKSENSYLIVECLTLWLTNILFNTQGALQQKMFEQETRALFDT